MQPIAARVSRLSVGGVRCRTVVMNRTSVRLCMHAFSTSGDDGRIVEIDFAREDRRLTCVLRRRVRPLC